MSESFPILTRYIFDVQYWNVPELAYHARHDWDTVSYFVVNDRQLNVRGGMRVDLRDDGIRVEAVLLFLTQCIGNVVARSSLVLLHDDDDDSAVPDVCHR